ncbi:hypothetical protein LY76DRAFT_285621 [Colletotrichum caudatum]|nr:hypothetical protein LY76DRAFT_285621 [Colletotrichum caudatum]
MRPSSPFPLADDTHPPTTWRPGGEGRGGTWNVGIERCPVVPEPREARRRRSEGRGRGRGRGQERTRREQADTHTQRHDECSGQILHVWSETCRSALAEGGGGHQGTGRVTRGPRRPMTAKPGKGRGVCVCVSECERVHIACWDEDATSVCVRGEGERVRERRGEAGQRWSNHVRNQEMRCNRAQCCCCLLLSLLSSTTTMMMMMMMIMMVLCESVSSSARRPFARCKVAMTRLSALPLCQSDMTWFAGQSIARPPSSTRLLFILSRGRSSAATCCAMQRTHVHEREEATRARFSCMCVYVCVCVCVCVCVRVSGPRLTNTSTGPPGRDERLGARCMRQE